MTVSRSLRPVPIEDRVWLHTALADALDGGAPVLPVAPGTLPAAVQRLQEADLPEGTAVVVRTSGSSGIPKSVALSAQALQASAEATHQALGGPGQWLVNLPTNLISGLQMLVRSHLAGIEPVYANQGNDPHALIQQIDAMQHERRFLSVVPIQLGRMLLLAEHNDEVADTLRGLAAVLVGGQAVPVAMRQQAHNLGIHLRRSYGMTETAGGCVYDGVELGDTEIRIRDGEVQLAGSSLAIGYIADQTLTAERFVCEHGKRWYRTGDAGYLLGGMLTVSGRLDRVIISGGINVSLDEIERVVSDVAGWQHTIATSVSDADWGERAVLIRERGAAEPGQGNAQPPLAVEQVFARIKQELGVAAVPLRVVEITEIPRLSGGKPDFVSIRSLLANDL